MPINSGDTAWILMSAALVMLMTPGLALFYGGMVRRKNILSTMMLSFVCLGLIGVLWVVFGYSLVFGKDIGGIIGGLNFFGLSGVGISPSSTYATTVPQLAFMAFQGMFAIITVALVSGAVVERVKFSGLLIFSVLWMTIVYAPVAHWVWGSGGWLANLGVLDFAGGIVVHINAGFSALALALVLGRRRGFPKQLMEPNNIPMVVLGAGLLWFGWFGFNAGSALAANGIAANAFVTTNTAAATAAVTWMILSWIERRPTVLGIATGCIAGLGAITPAAGFVSPLGAIAIGFVSALLCYGALYLLKIRWGLDDSLDVCAIHGTSGVWGTLATGLFATLEINAAGANGLFNGDPSQLVKQLIGGAAVAAFAFVVSWVLGMIIDKTVGLRVGTDEETVGLDISQHGERAYGGTVR